tara:strand:+ start:5399 stop:6373 length:975 start_codon:yes stop_codon:yes gene_type:complete
MKKSPLEQVKAKLNKYYLAALTAEELQLYFDSRLEKVLRDKKIVTMRELEYLLCETGPGDRRFDPRHIPLLIQDDDLLSTSPYENISEIIELGEKKKKIDEYLRDNQDTEATRKLILKVLSTYVSDLKVTSQDPFVVDGTFDKIPISFLIKNGQWVLPNEELFAFLQETQRRKRLPVVVARKISGILFPMFKGTSVLGLNLYKTYVPKSAKKLVDAAVIPAEGFMRELRYSGQFEYLTKDYIEGIEDEYWTGDPLKNFFEVIMPKHAEDYYQRFVDQKITIADNFVDTVLQFRKNKATKGLLNTYETQENLIQELSKITKKKES